jgi:hypothetical protein
MKPLARHLDNYLNLRRQLGYKLRGIDNLLRHFVRFAEQERAPFITTKLALAWATYATHLPLKQKALSAAQPESSQQQQDGVIAPPDGG